jgi:hypothetical protein
MVCSDPFTGQNFAFLMLLIVRIIPNKHSARGDKSLQPFPIHSFQQSEQSNSFFLFSRSMFEWWEQIAQAHWKSREMNCHSDL